MKNLKFRAWDDIAKKYLWPWPNGFAILGETNCFDLIGQQLHKRNPEKTVLDMLNDIVLEQFTGLKDKHGEEIYEGDRIKTYDPIKLEQGKDADYIGIVSWSERSLMWILVDDKGKFVEMLCRAEQPEVVGTIHDKEIVK